jgi:hypothetical protein
MSGSGDVDVAVSRTASQITSTWRILQDGSSLARALNHVRVNRRPSLQFGTGRGIRWLPHDSIRASTCTHNMNGERDVHQRANAAIAMPSLGRVDDMVGKKHLIGAVLVALSVGATNGQQ